MRMIVPCLDPMQTLSHIIGYVNSRTEVLQSSIQTRLVATHLLGTAAECLPNKDVEARFLHKILFLCQVRMSCILSTQNIQVMEFRVLLLFDWALAKSVNVVVDPWLP